MVTELTIEPIDRPSSLADAQRLAGRAAPLAAAIAYPLLLAAYHAAAQHLQAQPWTFVLLLPALAVPLIGFACAVRSFRLHQPTVRDLRFRRLSLSVIAAPPLYVFLGVVQDLLRISIPDIWTWTAAWMGLGLWASAGTASLPDRRRAMSSAGLRVAHGVAACVLVLFVAFHLANHLLAIYGPGFHATVMDMGRRVYRAPLIEPPLAVLFLFQAGSGVVLLERATYSTATSMRVFQLASGAYLTAYILCHMNSVFVYARLVRHVGTGWAYASGAPAGLLADPWNVRLLPHYAFGVFAVLGHLTLGLRHVALAHGVPPRAAQGLCAMGLTVSAIISGLIVAVLCGLRIN